MGLVQLTFLRLLSKEVLQNVTYTCINSVAWYDEADKSFKNAIKLLGANDDEFTAGSPINNEPVVDLDGCKVTIFRGSHIS